MVINWIGDTGSIWHDRSRSIVIFAITIKGMIYLGGQEEKLGHLHQQIQQ